jgi:hypothetical protein
MASEDLHFLGRLAGADDTPVRLNLRDPLLKEADDPQAIWQPTTIRDDVRVTDSGLLVVGVPAATIEPDAEGETPAEEAANAEHEVRVEGAVSSDTIRLARQADAAAIIVEDPFAWDLPIWLASQQIDGFFLMGDGDLLRGSIGRLSLLREPIDMSQGGI